MELKGASKKLAPAILSETLAVVIMRFPIVADEDKRSFVNVLRVLAVGRGFGAATLRSQDGSDCVELFDVGSPGSEHSGCRPSHPSASKMRIKCRFRDLQPKLFAFDKLYLLAHQLNTAGY